MEKERLKYCINRWDHYYDSINNKNAVFLALSTFIAGALTAAYPSILERVQCGIWIHFFMIVGIGLSVAIMIIVIMAATPFLSAKEQSLLYFGAVSTMKEKDYYSLSVLATEEEDLADLRKQAYRLSKGLSKKFMRLKVAGILFAIQFYLFIPLTIIIICNIK